MADVLPWGVKEKLTLEKTAIGFYLTGHLFDEVEAEVRRFVRTPIGEMRDSREPQSMAGILSEFRTINGQRGRIGIFKIDDKSGVIEASADDKVLEACRDLLKDDEFVVVTGRLQPDHFSGGLRMKVQQVWSLPVDALNNVVDVAVCRLRSKLDDPYAVKLLHTVRGMGYLLALRDGDPAKQP